MLNISCNRRGLAKVEDCHRDIRVRRSMIDIRRYSIGKRVAPGWNSPTDSLRGTVLGFKSGYNEWMSRRRLGA